MTEQKPKYPVFAIVVSHLCIQREKTIVRESDVVRLSPKDLSDNDLLKVPTKQLGQWVHSGPCFNEYFKLLTNTK